MSNDEFPIDFSADDIAFVRSVQPFTVTSPERIIELRRAVHYLNRDHVPGAFVECGVYRGGSTLAAMKATREGEYSQDREFWLYDTFKGMPDPPKDERTIYGLTAKVDILLNDNQLACSLEDVRGNIRSMFGRDVSHYVIGKVEDTIPDHTPSQIALLRLDTDWYSSTLHELQHLYPRLVSGGILLIDDYGHWDGARRAVDEYFQTVRPRPFLGRIDYTGRIGVKP